MSEEMLVVTGLNKSFGGLAAVQNISLSVPKGSIVSLIGPNGAGKTTVFNLISGFYKPDSGSIILDGEDVTQLKPYQYTKKGLVRTFQNVRLFRQMTVLENIMIGAQINTNYSVLDMVFSTPKKRQVEQKQREMSMEFLREMGMGDYANEICSNLPYGLQKKLEIIRAIASEPKLLLVDEPAAGLNPQESEELSEFIRSLLARGITVMLIEHDISMVMNLSDYVYVMDHGTMLSHGRPEVVQQDERVIEAYIGKRGARNAARS